MRLLVVALLLALVAASVAAWAVNQTQVEEFKHSKFYEIVSRLTSTVYHVGDLTICPSGCSVKFAVRDLSAGVVEVYELRGFRAVLKNVTISFAVEPVIDKKTDEVKAAVVNCYFNASRVELDAPNITRIAHLGSHMFYMFRLPKPVTINLGGYRLEIRGFAFIVTPEALRKHQVWKHGNNTVIFGFTTGIIPDAVIHADDVELPVGYVHEYPAAIYLLYEAAKGNLPRVTLTVSQPSGSAASGSSSATHIAPLALGAVAAAAAIAAYAAWRKRR